MVIQLKYFFSVAIFIIPYLNFAQKKILNKSKMCETLSEMIKKDTTIRNKIPDNFNKDYGPYSKKDIDSLKVVRTQIDKFNTEKLIEITKEYGWISAERIDCDNLETWLIFRHSDPKYFDEIAELIEKEHKAKRLSTWHYTLIKNHLQGRSH